MNLLRRFKKIPYLIQYLYDKMINSIAFLPSLIALGFIIFVAIMIYFERSGLTPWMEDYLPSFFFIKSWDVAQSILVTLIGALISLMVFSFSMVMVLLNNAASNYSPRILPGLVADRFHQFVLGTYLGTIIYCMILVINMTPTQDKIPLPGFSVLYGIFLGISCLMLFVFFIHSISESVQVGKILEKLYVNTISKMESGTTVHLEDEMPPHMISRWPEYMADRSGHLRSINAAALHLLCANEKTRMKVLISESKFVLEGNPLFAMEESISDEVRNKILEEIIISTTGTSQSDYSVGFKYITEIAVKAMSPGINDPGTAVAAIDYLTILFNKQMTLPTAGAYRTTTKDGTDLPSRLWLSSTSFDELLTYIMAPIRQYARHDLVVMLKLLEMLDFLNSRNHCSSSNSEIIHREVLILKEDAEEYLTNKADYNRVLTMVNRITNTSC